jgi:hypothetical protein
VGFPERIDGRYTVCSDPTITGGDSGSSSHRAGVAGRVRMSATRAPGRKPIIAEK